MSFRFADLKKTVRRTKDGRMLAPARLEGRSVSVQVEFLLQQFEQNLGQPRKRLDPAALLDFIGDGKLGRGLMATLGQWYRIRPRTFAEVLARGGGIERTRLTDHGLIGPVVLRAWLYASVNIAGNPPGPGYLDPESEAFFWQRQARTLGVKREALQALTVLDHPEEAVLVRTGPRPSAADVMAAYNARAHTTLLRSAAEVTLRCAAPVWSLEQAAREWAEPLGVDWSRDGDALRLRGQADALGSWTRHGRRVERVAMELLSSPELSVREVRGRITALEEPADFRWREDILEILGGTAAEAIDEPLDRILDLATGLRRERDAAGTGWTVRQPMHVVGVAGAVCQPHLELRFEDVSLYLRLGDASADSFAAFHAKTPVAVVSEGSADGHLVRLAGEEPEAVPAGSVLAYLAERVHGPGGAELPRAA